MIRWLVSREYNRLDAMVFYAMGICVAVEWYWTMLAVFVVGILLSATLEVIAKNRRTPDTGDGHE